MHFGRLLRSTLPVILLTVLWGGCNTQQPASPPASQVPVTQQLALPSSATPTPQTPVVTQQPESPTTAAAGPQAPIVLGYVDASPAAFIPPEADLVVEVSDATYNPGTGGLEHYKVTIRHPSGTTSEVEFNDIAFNTQTGLTDGYSASIDGTAAQGPSMEEFDSLKSSLGTVLAFSLNSFAGNEPLPVISLPCSGDSKAEYGQVEGRQQVTRHEITCGTQTYILHYSDYTYDEQLGTLSGYTVQVEMP